MIAVGVAAAIGFAVCSGIWWSSAGNFAAEPLSRTNYRGVSIPTGVGSLIAFTALIVGAAGYLLMSAIAHRPSDWFELWWTSVFLAVAFGLLGLIDDLVGVGQSGGFRSHLRAAAHGRLTSGSIKLIGGAAAGIVAAGAVQGTGADVVPVLRDGAAIALAANLANLFDRAPGRATKVCVAGFAAAVVVCRCAELAGPAVGIGAGLALLAPDLREKVMLGDAGANPLGALVGLAWLVALPSDAGRWVLVAVLLVANVASERVSFSAVIDGFPPLRWLDRLGSVRPR